MQTLLFHPRPIVLTGGKVRREPTRPVAHRPPDFAKQFDFDTLLYDCFYSKHTEVVVAAPPFLNLLPLLENMDIVAAPSGRRCPFRIRTLDRHSQIRITVPAGTTSILLCSELGRFDLTPQENLSAFFADRRVLFTKSKNNRFEWIQDWIRYHRDIHGANAVLIYDNQSTAYPAEDLLASLSELSGIDRLCVVSWPFLFGPQGLDAKRFWDSDFCEFGICEHARRMFLQDARSVLHSDIDELVVSNDKSSIFDAAERSRFGVIRYSGHWVHGFQGMTPPATDQSPIRFVDFDHYLRYRTGRRWAIVPTYERNDVCPPKWTVLPKRCPDRAQWTSHRIKGWIAAFQLNRNFSFRHFREINNNWKYDRSTREVFDSNRYAFDRLMCSNFSAVRWHA